VALYRAAPGSPANPIRIDGVRWHPIGLSGRLQLWNSPNSRQGFWYQQINTIAINLDNAWEELEQSERDAWEAFANNYCGVDPCPCPYEEQLPWWMRRWGTYAIRPEVTAFGVTCNKDYTYQTGPWGSMWYITDEVIGIFAFSGQIDAWLPPGKGYFDFFLTIGTYAGAPPVRVNGHLLTAPDWLWYVNPDVEPPPCIVEVG
jgi:hypothetical protein